MKKIVIMFIVFVFLFGSISLAEDLSSLSSKELVEKLQAILSELENRKMPNSEKGSVVVDDMNIKITIDGEPYFNDGLGVPWVLFPIIVENNSKQKINFSVEDPSVNGWMLNRAYISGTMPLPGKKALCDLCFNVTDAQVKSIDDFTYTEFTIVIKDENYKDIEKLNPQIIYAANINGE